MLIYPSRFDPLRKPDGPVVLDQSHPFMRGHLLTVPFDVRKPNNVALDNVNDAPRVFTGNGLAAVTSRFNGNTDARWLADRWGHGWYSAHDSGWRTYLDLGADASLAIPTTGATFAIIRRLIDTHGSAGSLFGASTNAGEKCNVNAPWNDGSTYATFGAGANEVNFGAVVYDPAVADRIVFRFGTLGTHCWVNGKSQGGSTTPVSRSATTGSKKLIINDASDPTNTAPQEAVWYQIHVVGAEWNDDLVRWWSEEPYAHMSPLAPSRRYFFFLPFVVEGLTIAGTLRSIRRDWSIAEELNERGTFRFTVPSVDGTVRPALREAVNFVRDSVRLFAGTIYNMSEAGWGGRGLTPIDTACGATDFNELPDRRQVSITLAAGTLKSMLVTLVTYLSGYGVTLDPAQVNGPTQADDLTFELGSLTGVLDKLSVITGYAWEIGYDKVLRMFDPGTDTASFDIADGGPYVIGDLTVTPTTQQYGNHITVRAGTGTQDVEDHFTGDGVEDTFPLSYPVASLYGYVTVNAVVETLGPGATWEYEHGTNSIVRTAGAPANLADIDVTYVGSFPFEVTAEDVPAQDGGANLYELVFTHPEVMHIATAQALADGYLARALVTPREIRYRTRTRVRPGEQQHIQCTARNVDADCLITQVEISMEGKGATDAEGSWLNYDVTAVEGLVIPLTPQAAWRSMGRIG